MVGQQGPVAGIDYPRNIVEFNKMFNNEASCRKYLIRLGLLDGYQCPQCESRLLPWITKRGYFHCRKCQSEISIKVGTIFEGARISLREWFYAIWLVAGEKYGITAKDLQKSLCLGSYQTALTLLHKIRCTFVRLGKNPLDGCIEVDETYVGTKKKHIVLIAVELQFPKGIRLIKMRLIPDMSNASLIQFICNFIKPGSEIRTDGWSGYDDLLDRGYIHKKIVPSDSGDPTHVAMRYPRIISWLLRRWLQGIYKGAISGKYFDYYLDEFSFRFNHRNSYSQGLLFYRLMEKAIAIDPITILPPCGLATLK